MNDLLKKSTVLQGKIRRYEKLSNNKNQRNTKQKTYEKELLKAIDEYDDLEKKINMEAKKFLKVKEGMEKNKKLVNDLKNIYCGALKPRKGQKKGTFEECKRKGQIRLYGLNEAPTKGKKGGKLAVSVLKKFIQESHKDRYNDVGDYKIDRQLSHEWVKVYYNSRNNQAVVVHRGSSDLADAWTDTKLFFQQKNNKRFKISEKVQKEAEQKYGAQNVTTVGSSLGGYLAEQYRGDSKEIISVSKPTTPLDVLKGKKKADNQYNIRVDRDPVRILQNFQKGPNDIVIHSNSLNPFNNHMGDSVLSKLDENKMIGKGGLSKLFKSMRVNQIKELVKLLRKHKAGGARQYPISGKKKCDLCKMVEQLKGGNLSNNKKNTLWEKLNVMFMNNVVVPLFKYLSNTL